MGLPFSVWLLDLAVSGAESTLTPAPRSFLLSSPLNMHTTTLSVGRMPIQSFLFARVLYPDYARFAFDAHIELCDTGQ